MISSQYQFHMKEGILRLGKVVLMALALTVGFFSCEKKEDVAPVAQNSGTDAELVAPQASLNSANASMMRSSDYYSVAQKYKNSYSHTKHWHGIAQGFVNWWNCIANAEYSGTISVNDVLAFATGRQKELKLEQFHDKYGVTVTGYKDHSSRITAATYLLDHFIDHLNGGQPVAVLIRNNYSGKWGNSLVVVLTYNNGSVCYWDSRLDARNGITCVSLSYFVSMAKSASSDGKTVNVVHW